jgi:hypothetical protein
LHAFKFVEPTFHGTKILSISPVNLPQICGEVTTDVKGQFPILFWRVKQKRKMRQRRGIGACGQGLVQVINTLREREREREREGGFQFRPKKT